MMKHTLDGAYSDSGSQVLWEDGERVFRRGWRLDDDGKQHARCSCLRLPVPLAPRSPHLGVGQHPKVINAMVETASPMGAAGTATVSSSMNWRKRPFNDRTRERPSGARGSDASCAGR